ncbi:hypothetical protein [Acaryochloris marina]|uniref:Helix-turn-helix domain-containing protein n=1 Tax=Acaryochloris marina (strain MBIC 11017) TaxID=329726 RepID=B0C4V9_ACAM1|nr:hypothetical protein [Acaryochloris marina]ABW31097.1 hypothetical protein AM1_6165 [Acaryochloris marina MBIC11017]BDM79806.1 hypothetical protein AM10699_26740 [Acaryochloris marina MBIC10699]
MFSSRISPEAATSLFGLTLTDIRQAIYNGELPAQWNHGSPLLSYTDLLNYQFRKVSKSA